MTCDWLAEVDPFLSDTHIKTCHPLFWKLNLKTSPWGGYSGREWSFFETFDGGNWRAPLLLDPCRNQDCFLEKDITSSKGPSTDQLCFCVMAWQNNCRLATPVGYLMKSPGWEWPENDNVVNGLDISKNNHNFFKTKQTKTILASGFWHVVQCSTTTFTWQST